MGFQIVALRLLKGNDPKLSKKLTENHLFKFYSNTNFEFENDEIVNFYLKESIEFSLFNKGDSSINVSAIVGKNGTGKSSLIEIIYLLCYKLAARLDYLKKLEGEAIEEVTLYNTLRCELYYQKGTISYKLVQNGEGINLYSNESGKFSEKNILKSKKDLENLFFSLVVDYSLYGLNEETAFWAKPLFHKNDGYQIPIVINPYRRSGIINVNSERHLVQSRMLLNFIEDDIENPRLINNLKANSLHFSISQKSLNEFYLHEEVPAPIMFWDIISYRENESNVSNVFFSILDKLTHSIGGYTLSYSIKKSIKRVLNMDKSIWQNRMSNDNSEPFESLSFFTKDISFASIRFFLCKYIIGKVLKIAYTYSESVGLNFEGKNKKDIAKEFLLGIDLNMAFILNEKSHISIKLSQAIASLKNIRLFKLRDWSFTESEINGVVSDIEFHLSMTLKEYKSVLLKITKNENSSNNKDVNVKIENIPFGALKLDLKFSNENFGFSSLSSGEQHFINVIQNVKYHLRNLNSVHSTKNDLRVKYDAVNIIMEEVELYFHPEFQRVFVKELITAISELKLDKIQQFNILLITHSPVILSDLPKSNILMLEEESETGLSISTENTAKTFGANIHDLLAVDFFLDKGFVGEFAKEKINEVIYFVNYKKNIKKIEAYDTKIKLNKHTDLDILRHANLKDENLLLKKKIDINSEKFYLEIADLIGEKIVRTMLMDQLDD